MGEYGVVLAESDDDVIADDRGQLRGAEGDGVSDQRERLPDRVDSPSLGHTVDRPDDLTVDR